MNTSELSIICRGRQFPSGYWLFFGRRGSYSLGRFICDADTKQQARARALEYFSNR